MTVTLEQRDNREISFHGTVWRVETGSLAMFAVELHDGQPRGRRTYLFDVGAGEIFLEMKGPEDARHALLAVPVQPPVLTSLEADDLAGSPWGQEALATWIGKLRGVCALADHPVDPFVETERDFFQALEHLDELAEKQSLSRLEEQLDLNRRLAAGALLDLAGAAPERRSGRSALEDPVQAVGEALGIRLSLPSGDVDSARDPVQAIALASGVRMRSVLLSGPWWKEENGPLLGYTASGRSPVALLPAGGNRYELFDPADGSRRLMDPLIADSLEPVAYSFYRSFGENRRASDLIRFGLRGYKKDIQMLLLCTLAITFLGMVAPQATALLFAHAIPDGDRGMLLQIVLGMAVAVAGSMLFDLTRAVSTMRIQSAAAMALEAAAWDWLLKLSPAFFRKYSAGELRARVEGFGRILEHLRPETVRALSIGASAILYLGLMFYYSLPLGLCAAVCGLLVFSATAFAWGSLSRVQESLEQMEGSLSGLMVQLINAVPKLRIAGAEQRAFAYWGKFYSRKQRIVERARLLCDRLQVVNAATPTLALACAFYLTPRGNGFDVGTFLAFTMALGVFMQAITQLSDRAAGLVAIPTHWRRVKTILEEPPEVDSAKANPGRLTGRLALDQVTFRYRKEGRLTLENVSIHANPGECIALVGPSGSGKSTILNLLLGFEIPSSGTVLLDGQDLAGLDLTAVRRQFGVVRQDSRLMSQSIFENIVCGCRCTMDDAWEAARAAGLAQDIEQMPMGMHTMVSEGGANLSGGQRQRLLIARALVLRPKILLFDEATSALDNRTQQIVTESVQRLKATRVLVAHRLSTIRQADRIYVIEAGRVAQQGTFDELAGRPGLFAQLIKRQLV